MWGIFMQILHHLKLYNNSNLPCWSPIAVVRLRQVQYLQEPDVQRIGLHPRHLLLPRGTN